MKSIVVGVDLNEVDEAILKKAVSLGRATGATLHLVHVFPAETSAMDYVVYVPVDPEKRKAAIANTHEKLEERVSDLERKGVQAEAKIKFGHPHDKILEYAEEVKADVIVVGTQSRNAVSRVLLGATADKVVRRSPVPILVVPTME